MTIGLVRSVTQTSGWLSFTFGSLLVTACTNSTAPIDQDLRLLDLEEKAYNTSSWPSSPEQAAEFIDELGSIIGALSPHDEAAYFPRLAELRWMAIGFRVLYPERTATSSSDSGDGEIDESSYSTAVQLRAIAEEKPVFTDSRLENSVSALERKLLAHANKLENQDIEQRLDQVRGFLRNSTNKDSYTYSTVPEQIFENLDYLNYYYDSAPEREQQINPELEKLKIRLKGLEQEALEKPRREYQAWALDKIWTIEQILEDTNNGMTLLNPNLDDDEYAKIQNAVIEYLLPIDQRYLELPVSNRYHGVFDEAWKALNDQNKRKAQNCIAIASIWISKRTIDSATDFDPLLERLDRSEQWSEAQCDQ